MKNSGLRLFVIAGVVLIQGCSTGARNLASTPDASSASPAASAAPAVTTVPFVVNSGILTGRLRSALLLLKDQAISSTSDGHVILSVGGQSIDCFSGIVKDASGINTEVNNCTFNFPVSPVGQVPAAIAPLLYQALNLYASQPSVAGDSFVRKVVERAGTRVTIDAQSGEAVTAFPSMIPQSLRCDSIIPYSGSAMIDCTLSVYEMLNPTDTQTVAQSLESSPEYSKLIRGVKKTATVGGYTKPSTHVWRGMSGEVKEVTVFSSGAPEEMGRIQPSRTMVINADSVFATPPAAYRVTGVFYGMD